ncbi:hypothetical protein BKA61DRAFT_707920 [Leptodontidium sp. MPI-SDFR-AT-0119]|nr:hypothetical protein BKA61DRAFT_707920 [Leptodontidium sp. MPI-SDFR-AT-0119]
MSISIPQGLFGRRSKGPYKSPIAIIGGTPNPTLDVPITGFFLLLFMVADGFHFFIHEKNKKKKHKFHLSALMPDFCLVRTITCILRIAWGFRPTNNGIVLTALIFENAGAVVLFAVNAIFTQRIIRALHPNFGWSLVLNVFFFIAVYSVPFIIAYNIVFTVIAFYTLNPHIEAIVRGFLLFGLCYTLSLSLLPILCILPRTFVPHIVPIERFGTGIFRSKIGILLFSTVLLLAGAVVRLASHVMQHTTENPGVIESKQVFYIVGFAFEITVVVLRFWVPDGAKGPGDYGDLQVNEEKFFKDMCEKKNQSASSSSQGLFETQNWFGTGSLEAKPTREQVRIIIHNLGFPAEIVGMPMDCGEEEEILLYAFRARKVAKEQMARKMVLRQSRKWSCDTVIEDLK